MKKSIIFLLVVFVSSICSGQKNIDKMMEKYNVSSAVVSGHLFAVGDTLSLGSGSLPNGEFLCSMLSPDLLLKPGVYPPHLPANYLNFKFIIAKIRQSGYGVKLYNYTSILY